MREIKKEELQTLVDKKIIRNSSNGFLDRKGFPIGYSKTKNKRYIEDKYLDILRKMS